MALRLKELNPNTPYEFIGNWTGNEPAELGEHLRKLERILGSEIKRIGYHTDLHGLIEELQMIPNFRARFCTRVLKIEPTIAYFQTLPPGSTLYVGLRADEELRTGIYGEDIITAFPMREWGWGLSDVTDYLDAKGICIPDRTDCELCPHQRLGEWRNLYYNNRLEYYRGIAWETQLGHTFRSDGRDTWPASLYELAKEFEKGRPIRKYKSDATKCRVCSL